jgi:hypothetical protein
MSRFILVLKSFSPGKFLKSIGMSAHLTVPEFLVRAVFSGKPAHVNPRLLLNSLILQDSMLSLGSEGGSYAIGNEETFDLVPEVFLSFGLKPDPPKFHTNLFPNLIQEYLRFETVFTWPLVLQVAPALTEACAGIERDEPIIARTTRVPRNFLFM